MANLHILKEKVKREENGLSEYDNIVDGNRPSDILKAFESYLFEKSFKDNQEPGRKADGQLGYSLLKDALSQLKSSENITDGDLLDRLYFQIGKSVRLDMEEKKQMDNDMMNNASPEMLKIYQGLNN